jgi:hypothetical protein
MATPSSSKTPNNMIPVTQHNNNNNNQNHTQSFIKNKTPIPTLIIPTYETIHEDPSIHQNTNQQPNHSNYTGSTSQSGPRRPPGFFVYPEKVVTDGVSACQRSILGKLITNKPVHVSSIQMGLDSIWGAP